jgi:hypothetical protein
MADEQYGALVVPHTYAYAPATARIEIMGRAAERYGKIACAVWLTQHLEGRGRSRPSRTPTLRCSDPCVIAWLPWRSGTTVPRGFTNVRWRRA